jgi:CBS domain-containing protein
MIAKRKEEIRGLVGRRSDVDLELPPPSGVRLRMQVRDVMSWPAAVVTPETPTAHALRLATENAFHHFPVVAGRSLVGVICTCDLSNAGQLEEVGNRMSAQPVSVEADATLADASVQMDEAGVDCLLVSWLDAWGIITRGDLVRAGACDDHDRPHCTTCGARHHVRPAPRSARRWLCIECLDDEEVAELYRDWGEGD